MFQALLNVWHARICGKLVFSSAKQKRFFSRFHHRDEEVKLFLCRLVIVRALVIDLTVRYGGGGVAECVQKVNLNIK